MNFAELKTSLRAGPLEVTFKKVNGETRVMTCTTNMDLIPPSSWPIGNNVQEEEQHRRNVRVYDINAQGWRSFIFDNIIEVKQAS